ncbi:MAG TPA: response regulator [Polyangiaceae bacterium]|nr:response regulator [Polyangiaceae bacterium]
MSKPVRVLLIEDNPADADLTKETLESGRILVDIMVATNGAEALAQLKHRDTLATPLPDLILLDLNLPRIDGRHVLREIKKDNELRRIPVVILTSSDAERDIVQSYELGANCYVTKPVGLQAFQSIVRSLEGFWLSVVRLP